MIAVIPEDNREAAEVAREGGCTPLWWPPYGAWCCGCEDLRHAMDQQCSVINSESARR